jgi:AcrR family transcriptional regulator
MTKHLPEHKRRDEILAAARSLFVERGYGPTKMSDIAARANLSKGGVYFHFVSKDEVFEALVEDQFERSMGAIRELTAGAEVTSQMFAAMGQYFYSQFQADSDAARFFVVMGEMALRSESLRKKLVELQQRYWQAIAEMIEKGIAAGLFRRVDPRSAAIILKATLDGIEANAAFDRGQQMGEMNVEAMLDVALRGLLA